VPAPSEPVQEAAPVEVIEPAGIERDNVPGFAS